MFPHERWEFERMFRQQIKSLEERNLPEAIKEMLEKRHDDVIKIAERIHFFRRGSIFFLPIIPRIYLSVYSQIQLVRNNGKAGYTHIDVENIVDLAQTPDRPYYIFDVDIGRHMRGKFPGEVSKLIERQETIRRCLTDVEAISLCIHTNILQRYTVDATGSMFLSSKESEVPQIVTNFSERIPLLATDYIWRHTNPPRKNRVSPSCNKCEILIV